MFFVLGFVPGYVLSWILNAAGLLRVPREVELAGLDHETQLAAARDADEIRTVLLQEGRAPAPAE
jgi:Amt family ammonium transporter